MAGKKRAGAIIGIIVFVILVAGLYAIIYAVPRLEGIGIKTNIVQYEELPIADTVTALFVRDETLYTAAHSGAPQYIVEAGTKIRAGTQVVYIESGQESSSAGGEGREPSAFSQASLFSSSEDGEDTAANGEPANIETVSRIAGSDAVVSEGGVTPKTAIVSYYGDGWEKKVTPENIMELPKSVFAEAPGEAVELTRNFVNAGEPVYRITNNNLWRVAFWIENADKMIIDKYGQGQELRLNLGTTQVQAVVESAAPRGRDLFIVLKSDMYYKDLDKYRKCDIDVVFSEVSGAVIDKQSVKIKAGKAGVYVKQQSGTFKWVPVKVLEESGGRYLIAEKSFTGDDGQPVETIRYYDEIMNNPSDEGY